MIKTQTMVKSQTVISIRRDKVDMLRTCSKQLPGFFKMFMNLHHISNFPVYIHEAIFVSHSEHSSINSCHLITPFLGATLTNSIHKAFEYDDNDEKKWFEKDEIIKNLVMGFKGEFEVPNLEKLEIEADFATAKNSVYSVFGFNTSDFNTFTDDDFEHILDIVEFKEKDKHKEQQMIDLLPSDILYLGSFALRQVCLVFQSDGVFKAFPFKSNKNINFDTNQIASDFRKEALKLNHRFKFASKEKEKELLMKYVATYDFRSELSNRLFSAFIDGLKGIAVPVIKEETAAQIKAKKRKEKKLLEEA